MTTLSSSNYAFRLRSAREMAKKTIEDAAKSIDISVAAYHDLESFDDEIIDCISLQQVIILSKDLHLNLLEFFSDSQEESQETVSLEKLANKIKEFLITQHITNNEFQELAGWEGKEECLEYPSDFLKYNIAALIDICETVGVNWLSVISGISQLHITCRGSMKLNIFAEQNPKFCNMTVYFTALTALRFFSSFARLMIYA